jgi:hypothetical protein
MAKARYRLDEVHNNFFTSNELRGIGWTDDEIKRLQHKPCRRYLAYWLGGWEFSLPLMAVLWVGAVLVYFAL